MRVGMVASGALRTNRIGTEVRILKKLRNWATLDANARWLTIAAAVLPIAISAGFRCVGVARTQGYLRAWASAGKGSQSSAGATELIRSARRALRIVRTNTGIQGTCLTRSMALWAALLRLGVATDLRFGIRKRAGFIEGHAWVEHQGFPINDTRDLIGTYEVYPHSAAFDEWARSRK